MSFKRFAIILLGLTSIVMAGDYFVPEIQSGNGNSTYIGVVNPGDATANLTIMGFGADGTEYGASAALTELPAMGMANISISDLFGDNAANIGWIKVNSLGSLHVFAEIMNEGLRSAYWSSPSLAGKLYMPHVAKNTASFTTVFSAVNATDDGFQTALFPKPSGSPKILSAHQNARNKVSDDILNYFADVSGIDWISMEVGGGVAGVSAMEYFKYNTKNAMASLGLEGTPTKTLRFLHVATDTGTFWTGMVYINVGDATASITEYYYDASGNVLKEFSPEALPANGKVTLLFDAANQERVPAGTAWVKVMSDQDLVGYELFGSANGTNDATFAGIQGNYKSGNVLDYPYFTAGTSEWSGFVALNVGDVAADLTLTLMDDAGNAVATHTKTGIAPNSKFLAVGATIFPNATGSWVRATASDSSFAGFLLWGDQGGTIRDNLSGINAMVKTVSTGGGTVIGPRQFIPETSGNDGYDTAMVLTMGEGGWNVNVVGNLDQNAGGKITNDYGNGTDVIESVFKITLTKDTSMVIGVRAAAAAADLDMFVVKGERPDGNFFDAFEHIDMDIDFAATAQGYESVCRVYTPGTYYVLVSLFDGDTIPKTDFGLLVSEAPLYINNFTFEDDVTRHAVTSWTGSDDTNGAADWGHFVWNNTKYGNALAQLPANGSVESSGLETPMLVIPENGFTVIDFDSSVIVNSVTAEDGTGMTLYLHYEGSEELEGVWGVSWNADVAGDPIDVNGTEMGFLMWSRYIGLVFALSGSTFEFELEPGFTMSVVIFCSNTGQTYLLDNFRIYDVAVSLDSKTRAEQTGKIAIQNSKPKFKKFSLIQTK